MSWRELHTSEAPAWQKRLHEAGASMFQFPSWLGAFNQIRFFTPVSYIYEDGAGGWGYCGLLKVNFGIVKIGLVAFGPVLPSGPAAIRSLLAYLKKQGFAFVRFSGQWMGEIKTAAQPYHIEEGNHTFPFYKDMLQNYLVYNPGDAETLKAGFTSGVRSRINRAGKAEAYTFIADDDGRYLDEVYDLFVRTGERKGFTYRPKESYRALFAQPGFASIYACIRDGRVMNAIIIIRDKTTSLNMSGGLDVAAVYNNISPAHYLHYFAMQQEFYKWGTQQYDLVYSASGGVAEFKKRFNPVHAQQPAPVSVVFKTRRYKLYSLLLLRYAPNLKKLGRKLAGK
jgi:Uncharacterized protein involved in methicillin resistance